jgi:hypothetical protein
MGPKRRARRTPRLFIPLLAAPETGEDRPEPPGGFSTDGKKLGGRPRDFRAGGSAGGLSDRSGPEDRPGAPASRAVGGRIGAADGFAVPGQGD